MGTVTFKVSPDGTKVEVEGEHFNGAECDKLAQKTLDALGKVDKSYKPEFYNTSGSGIKQG